jgi:hypothetical protein
MSQNKQNSEAVAKKGIVVMSTILQYPFCPLLHSFVYSVAFNITTIPLFGLYFTIGIVVMLNGTE